jgi:hypothetical protein
MLPDLTVPSSLLALLEVLRPCFTAPTFRTFCAMAVGLVGQTGSATVCGMLTGAGLERVWPHDRAHAFFATARWPPDRMGVLLARLLVDRLVPDGAPLLVAVDDTAHRRRGKRVHGAWWIHDGSARGKDKLAFGHRWVVAALVVHLPFLTRPVALPVLVRRWKGKGTEPVVHIARTLAGRLAAAFPHRTVHVVGDAAFHSRRALRDLPEHISWITRLPARAALYELAPAPTGRRGRPRLKGERLGCPSELAATAVWRTATVRRYGRSEDVQIIDRLCLWYGVFHARTVRVVRVRDAPGKPLLALVTTDLACTPEELVTRYAARWSIEITFFDCRQTLGVGQARNRTEQAVERTFPFGMYLYSLVVAWYAAHGHDPAVVTARRLHAPWYTTKAEPSFADMLAVLRRTLIAARFTGVATDQTTDQQIREVQQAWASAAA